MAIDLNTEHVLTLRQAAALTPQINGRAPTVLTLWRWCRKGIRGTHLEYVRVGRRIATTREALHRFFGALAASDIAVTPEANKAPLTSIASTFSGRRNARARQRAIAAADSLLAQAGM